MRFLVVVASIPGLKSSGMSTDLSANFNSPFGSSLAVIVTKAFDGLLMIPSRPVWIPGNHKVTNYMNEYSVVYLRNRKHAPCCYRVIETQVEVWETRNAVETQAKRQVFPVAEVFLSSLKLPRVFL